MLSIISIFATTALLSYLVYRGNTILLFSAFCTLLLVILSGGKITDEVKYIQVLLFALSKYFVLYFPIFLLGGIFGNLMKESGYSKVIAYWLAEKVGREQAILSTLLLCAVLTYSGLSLFVIAFITYPVIKPLFQCANIPKRLIPATISFGSFTFTMTAFPGSLTAANVMPTSFFHTDIYAASTLGIICGSAMFILGMLWLNYRVKQAYLLEEGYVKDFLFKEQELLDSSNSFTVAVLPLVIIVAVGLLLPDYIDLIPDRDFLLKRQYAASDINTFVSNIYISIGLLMGISAILASSYRTLSGIKKIVNKGAEFSLTPIVSTASVMGYCAVVSAVPAFTALKELLASFAVGNPILSSSLTSMVLSACAGSASGALGMVLDNMGEALYKSATLLGVDMEIVHRITSMSVGVFDSIPSNGAIISVMTITSLTFKESYKDIFVTTIVIPLIIVTGAVAFCLVM
ncbi:MAG: hypothetical protein LBJ03_01525 [Holosporales bacterium]|jgi:H+/gluconate symporter-like permease|nr:hypothetical protein [Holosporales bacterium]